MPKNYTGRARRCARCGAEYVLDSPKAVRKFCSSACRRADQSERQRSLPITKICPVCGKEFTPPNRNQLRCSIRCYRKTRPPAQSTIEVRQCVRCGKSFKTDKYGATTHCGRSCAQRDNNEPIERVIQKCNVCGGDYECRISESSRRKTCSPDCQVVYMRSQGKNGAPSNIEADFGKRMIDCGLIYVGQFPIASYSIDYAFPECKLAVECDGDYWHSTPRVIARDRKRDRFLLSRGWTVLRLRETDIRNQPTECVERVVAALSQLGVTLDAIAAHARPIQLYLWDDHAA